LRPWDGGPQRGLSAFRRAGRRIAQSSERDEASSAYSRSGAGSSAFSRFSMSAFVFDCVSMN
jgi:hypothetical protein